MFRSPTCTERDRRAAQELAEIAGITDMEQYAKQMFRAGSDLKGKTPDEILYQDFKLFNLENMSFGVGQISSMDEEELEKIEEQMQGTLKEALKKQKVDMIFLMLTNILDQSTELLFSGEAAKKLVERVAGREIQGSSVYLRNVVSRKKQFIPSLISVMQNQ